MNFEVREFAPNDLKEFAETAAETSLRPYLQAIDFDNLASSGPGWTGFWEGEPVAAGGFILPYGPDNTMRATAWAILLSNRGPWFLHVHGYARRTLREAPYRRIEAHVYCGFSTAQRWAELLGFRVETERKPCWAPDGSAVVEYVMLRDT